MSTPIDLTKRPMKGYVMADDTVIKTKNKFEYWQELALTFNKKAKSSKKKRKNSATKPHQCQCHTCRHSTKALASVW